MADITFTGNTGGDAELRHTRGGEPVLNVRVCDSKSRKTETGEWETTAEQWFNVALFGEVAEVMAPMIRKGDRVKVAGEFMSRPYEGRNGSGLSLDVRAVGIQVMPRRNTNNGGQPGGGQTPRQSWDNPSTGGDPWNSAGDAPNWG